MTTNILEKRNEKVFLNKHIRFFTALKGTVSSEKPMKFKIVLSSYCEKERTLYLKYRFLDDCSNNNSVLESYDIDSGDFEILCQNLFNPSEGQVLSIYEDDFLNIVGTATIQFIDYVPYVDTTSIRTTNKAKCN